MQKSVLIFLAVFLSAGAAAADQRWVTSDRLNRRTCPSINCGVVGQLFHREGVTVIEERGGWARITEPYYASCQSGESEFVDSGDPRCTASNGINNGRFSEWVSTKFLSTTRPDDPGAGATGIAKFISQSDDFRHYKEAFVKATANLVDSGRCTLQEFESIGGWVKSTTTYREQPVYFTYCGGFTTSDRIYLDAQTGRLFQ